MIIYVCYIRHGFFFMLNFFYIFVGSTNTIGPKCMFNISTIYIFIQVSGYVGRAPSALLCPGAYDAVKAALTINSSKKDNMTKHYTVI